VQFIKLEETGDTEVDDHLIESLDAACCRRWEETTEQMNFTKSSRKSWSLSNVLEPLKTHQEQAILR